MLKRVIALVFLTVFLCSFAFCLNVNAAPNGITISTYQANIDVGIDNSYTVNETLDIYYPNYNSTHDYIRYLPLINGQTGMFLSITDINVPGESFTVTDSANNKVITIQGSNKFTNDQIHYNIQYKISPGKDPYTNKDVLSYNVIPFYFEAPITSANVEINMPSEINGSELKIYSGPAGSSTVTNELNINSVLIGQKIILSGSNIPAKEGATVELTLPEGYFSAAVYPFEYLFTQYIPLIAIPLILLALLFWYRFGRDEEIIPVIGFKPPRNFNPAEIGYLADQMVDSEDIASLTIYWASHGHIRIEEVGGSYQLYLVTPLDEKHKAYEQDAFFSMFALGNGESVTKEELENHFYTTANTLKRAIPLNYSDVQQSLYEKSSLVFSYLVLGLAFLTHLLFLIIPFFAFQQQKTGLIFAGISTAIFIGLSVSFIWYSKVHFKLKTFQKTFSVIGVIVLSVVFIVFNTVYNSINVSFIWQPLQFFTLQFSCIFLIFLSMLVKKKSKFLQEIMQEIMGFKEFIETAEKDRIIALINDNPKYFYDILPYAIVLGVTDVWGNKFNGIVKEPPDWYRNDSSGMFVPSLFAISMLNYNHSMGATAVSTPNNAANGGFGGGGICGGGSFGGGGFGGGGGGFS